MSGCLSSSMTGSTDAGPLQPQADPVPLPTQPLTVNRPVLADTLSARRGRRRQARRKMTAIPPSGQAIQLTPLWEYVVRTRRFPSEVDTRATFVEISERLRDPEWEVRQHAVRVLMDVIPTLNTDVVDEVMQPVVPELINNLGHPAPAVRKGALDTLRVYLVHSPNRDKMVKNILHDGLNRPDAHNPFQTNVTTGVILSAPLLLFPSFSSPPPTSQVLKDATIAFASRLVQVPHQEAVLKSLMKIRDVVGQEEFESYLVDYDDKIKQNIEVLSKIYNIKPNKRKLRKNHTYIMKANKECSFDKTWDSDSDTSGIAEEEDESPNGTTIPSARVVLETEIKFNEKTAITMTILEEKDKDSNDERRIESRTDIKSVVDEDPSLDKRKTPRRVHFGGEIIKLRTPDSDETESIEITPKTRIPLPVSPATKMPEGVKRQSLSQPCSPHMGKRGSKRAVRSASSSPKKETYIHNAQLSPKKSILTRTSSLLTIDHATNEIKNTRNSTNERSDETIRYEEDSRGTVNSQKDMLREEQITLIQTAPLSTDNGGKTMKSNERNQTKEEKDASNLSSITNMEASKNVCPRKEQLIPEGDRFADVIDSNTSNISESFSRREKDYTSTELPSSPEKQTFKENREISNAKDHSSESQRRTLESLQGNFPYEPEMSIDANDLAFGSPVNKCNIRINRLVDDDFADDEQNVHISGLFMQDRAMTSGKYGEISVKESDRERKWRNPYNRKSASEGNGSVTCSSSEGEGKPQEPSWEELGLVGQEVLDDLHNKDDWRARVRALERVASALRTTSALIAIESRLGSLLHAVLGGERSCRVAAAGLAVAKVVVAGVSENALEKRLPQLACGLARQGGPAAAQLARIAMLRLRPSLLLEQLLQPYCLSARNAKTRENALQLLIFSLVTFPSTEFKVELVANRVVMMVADRRRRVRQAALDTLAVLAQIYDSEEILEAGKLAAEGCPDGEAMLAAIRARLARKSLPLVSADGLVVYGLQISPTIQIATGPDVDWIVAGSGSVSPGTGRTRGQIIATNRSAQGRISRNESTNGNGSPWVERSNLVALGIGLQPKTEQSLIWQTLPLQNCDDNENEIKGLNERNLSTGIPPNVNLRFDEQSRLSHPLPSQLYEPIGTDAKNYKDISGNYLEQKARKDVNEVTKEKESTNLRGESKIPVLSTRERSKITPQNRDNSLSLEYISHNVRRQAKDVLNNNSNRLNSRQENVRTHAVVHQRRKRLQQDDNTSRITSRSNEILNQTFDSHGYRPLSYTKVSGNRDHDNTAGSNSACYSGDNYGRFVVNGKFTDKNESLNRVEGRQRSLSRNMQPTLVAYETYGSIYQRQRQFMDRNAYRPLRTAPDPLTHTYQEFPNLDSRIAASSDRNTIFQPEETTDTQEHRRPYSENLNCSHRRRLRSLSPSQLSRSKQFVKLASNRFHAASMYDIDKATVNEEEYNTQNKNHFSSETNIYVQSSRKEEPRYEVDNRVCELPKRASSSSSDVSKDNREGRENQDGALPDRNSNNDSRSSTPQSRDVNPAFDILTQQTNCPSRDDVDSFFEPLNTDKCPIEMANASIEDDASKEWSSEDDRKSINRIQSISRRLEDEQLIAMDENCHESTESSSDIPEQSGGTPNARRKSVVSVIPNQQVLSYDDPETSKESGRASRTASSKKLETLYQSPSRTHHSPTSDSPSKRNSRCNSRNLAFEQQTEDFTDSSEERIVASEEDASIPSLDIAHPHVNIIGSSTIIIASRPHSHENVEYIENLRSVESTEEESSLNDILGDRQSKDSASETNTEPGILKVESHPMEVMESRRRIPSKVPRGTRYRMFSNKRAADKSDKSKPIVQQCFAQLEDKDWEVTIKGLKALSQISKQHPEYLDVCTAGLIGRLLGRHIRNLRSQVARAACLAANDVFSSRIRGIDQDIDDIAGPLLHRTADTNRFLRADSNAALDQMVQHLPPHKTIGIIVLRGASHQNAIVRAATARLLSEITERIGPEHVMILPRDVRDKLLNAGAKLLMDGNLDARNHAKKMFRRLTRCEGFRKALTDAVPETTLRHIDKTMKTL